MRFKHTNRRGFWLGFIDFFTAGLFFLLYMPLGGLQDELDYISSGGNAWWCITGAVSSGGVEKYILNQGNQYFFL